jgi:hypothetical protein
MKMNKRKNITNNDPKDPAMDSYELYEQSLTRGQIRNREHLLDHLEKDRVGQLIADARRKLKIPKNGYEWSSKITGWAKSDSPEDKNKKSVLKEFARDICRDYTHVYGDVNPEAWFYFYILGFPIEVGLMFGAGDENIIFEALERDDAGKLTASHTPKGDLSVEELESRYPFRIYFSPETSIEELKKFLVVNKKVLKYWRSKKVGTKRTRIKTARTSRSDVYILYKSGLTPLQISERNDITYGEQEVRVIIRQEQIRRK